MLNEKVAQIGNRLKAVLGPEKVEDAGRQSGFERRASRVIHTPQFVASLLLSLGTRKLESLADLHRDFNADHGVNVNYKPYYERLDSPGFVELLRSLFEAMLRGLYLEALAPRRDSLLEMFDDVLIHDGSSFALHEVLATVFPGRFTTVSPAAVELHATMSLKQDNLIQVALAADSECERHYAPEAKDTRNKLVLADRGYDSTDYMQRIQHAGGYFCIRIRSNLDPVVLRIHRKAKRYRALEGKRLSDVINDLPKGKGHDMDVAWLKKDGTPRLSFRLVISYHGSDRGWMRVMTNVPRDRFSARDILTIYSLRWQVELYFKELKSYANLHIFNTGKQYIAEGLIWASLCAAFLKRYFAHACQHATGRHGISTRRVAMCSHSFLGDFFRCMNAGFRKLGEILRDIFDFLAFNARRSNPKRERESGRLAVGLEPAGLAPLK